MKDEMLTVQRLLARIDLLERAVQVLALNVLDLQNKLSSYAPQLYKEVREGTKQ